MGQDQCFIGIFLMSSNQSDCSNGNRPPHPHSGGYAEQQQRLPSGPELPMAATDKLYGSVAAHDDEHHGATERLNGFNADDSAVLSSRSAGGWWRPLLAAATVGIMGTAAVVTHARVGGGGGGAGAASMADVAGVEQVGPNGGSPEQRIHDGSVLKHSAFTHALKSALTKVANSDVILFGHEEDNLKGQHFW